MQTPTMNCEEHGEGVEALIVRQKPRGNRKGSVLIRCRRCNVIDGRIDYHKYRDKRLANKAAYRAKNGEKLLAYWRAYRAKNREDINMSQRIRRHDETKRPKYNEATRKRYHADIEKSRAANRARAAARKERKRLEKMSVAA